MVKRYLTAWLLGISLAAAQDALPVRIQELSSLLSPVVFTAPAEVVTANRSGISARIEAQIHAVAVDVGDRVEAGQEIVVLDCTDNELSRERAQAELQSARVQLQRATQQLSRSETLARGTLVSADLLEQRQTEKEAAEAGERRARTILKQTELSVSRCRINSPFEGVVTERFVSVGELARPGTQLLEIVDLESLEIAAQVFPTEHEHLDSSPRIFFSFLNEEFPLRIDRRIPVIDPVTRTREVRLKFVGEKAPVGAGGRLVWYGKDQGVPAGLLVRRNDRLGVFVAQDGKATFHPLPWAREGRPAAIDLPPDTLIVTEGHQALRDGDSLNIAN